MLIEFDVQLFATTSEKYQDYSRRCILFLLSALVKCNLEYLRNYTAPQLYSSGVVYQREQGTEKWKAIPKILEDGAGDCEDLACWRVAELQRQGQYAKPFIRWREIQGFSLYHVLVQRGNDKFEDPSVKLGMRGPG